MRTYVALLRAVNLGPHNKIGMADLRALIDGLGFHDAKTLLQSGNVGFRCNVASAERVERMVEEALAARHGLKTPVFVRSGADCREVVSANPFPKAAETDPGHLLVVFLKHAPERKAVDALQRAISGRETIKTVGRHAYIVYPDGVGRSRLTTAMLEKGLGGPGTGRNWNTVLKLCALANEG